MLNHQKTNFRQMKKLIYLGFVIIFTLSFSSCKKCTVCQIKAGTYYESAEDEFCGTSSEVKDFEDGYAERAESLGLPTARAYCIRK